MATNRTICQGMNVRRKTVQRVGTMALELAVMRGGGVRAVSVVMITPESGSSPA